MRGSYRQGRRGAVALSGLLLLVVSSCGVPTSTRATPVPGRYVPPELPNPRVTSTVFVTTQAGTKVIGVNRKVPIAKDTVGSVQAALDVLSAGLTDEEKGDDYGTAIVPELRFKVTRADTTQNLVTIEPVCTDCGGADKLLFDQPFAVSQVVATATAIEGVGRVRFELGGAPLAVIAPDTEQPTVDPLSRANLPALVTNTREYRVYLVRNGLAVPVARQAPVNDDQQAFAETLLELLQRGPNTNERGDGFTSLVGRRSIVVNPPVVDGSGSAARKRTDQLVLSLDQDYLRLPDPDKALFIAQVLATLDQLNAINDIRFTAISSVGADLRRVPAPKSDNTFVQLDQPVRLKDYLLLIPSIVARRSSTTVAPRPTQGSAPTTPAPTTPAPSTLAPSTTSAPIIS